MIYLWTSKSFGTKIYCSFESQASGHFYNNNRSSFFWEAQNRLLDLSQRGLLCFLFNLRVVGHLCRLTGSSNFISYFNVDKYFGGFTDFLFRMIQTSKTSAFYSLQYAWKASKCSQSSGNISRTLSAGKNSTVPFTKSELAYGCTTVSPPSLDT